MNSFINNNQEASETLGKAIQAAVDEARSACSTSGDGSSECAVAWDIVEELQAECSHRKQAQSRKNSLESYCDSHPDALECLVYDV
ncbi:MAG: Calvin cycle protein CP12 [Cyanobacteria bacterium P01_A01_bin.84]